MALSQQISLRDLDQALDVSVMLDFLTSVVLSTPPVGELIKVYDRLHPVTVDGEEFNLSTLQVWCALTTNLDSSAALRGALAWCKQLELSPDLELQFEEVIAQVESVEARQPLLNTTFHAGANEEKTIHGKDLVAEGRKMQEGRIEKMIEEARRKHEEEGEEDEDEDEDDDGSSSGPRYSINSEESGAAQEQEEEDVLVPLGALSSHRLRRASQVAPKIGSKQEIERLHTEIKELKRLHNSCGDGEVGSEGQRRRSLSRRVSCVRTSIATVLRSSLISSPINSPPLLPFVFFSPRFWPVLCALLSLPVQRNRARLK